MTIRYVRTWTWSRTWTKEILWDLRHTARLYWSVYGITRKHERIRLSKMREQASWGRNNRKEKAWSGKCIWYEVQLNWTSYNLFPNCNVNPSVWRMGNEMSTFTALLIGTAAAVAGFFISATIMSYIVYVPLLNHWQTIWVVLGTNDISQNRDG